MGQRQGRVDRVRAGGFCSVIAGAVRRVRCTRFAVLAAFAVACAAAFGAAPAVAACPNEAARTGPSANLPDCRAYEQVTPADKSSASQDIAAAGSAALAAVDGERLVLRTEATLGPTPQDNGSLSVFSRTASGWGITSVVPAGSGDTRYGGLIFSPDLMQVGVVSETVSPFSPDFDFQVGVPGGPYATVAETPREDDKKHSPRGDKLLGGSADLSHVVFASTDHTLLSAGGTGTDERAYDLYEWSGGGACGSVTSNCKLVNEKEGHLISQCGAVLGAGELFDPTGVFQAEYAHNAVSADGSKIFFTVPDISGGEGEGCYTARAGTRGANPPRLYMRVSETVVGQEVSKTVEVSKPEGVSLSPEEEEMPVYYQVATADGSKVFFDTERALTPGAVKEDAHLYEYDTAANLPDGQQLNVIFQSPNKETGEQVQATTVFPSENGSVVYFYRNGEFYRYEAGAGPLQEIKANGTETPYSTPDGRFFLIASSAVANEPRGAGLNELYRYDHADGSVMCVSCGPGNMPAKGDAYEGLPLFQLTELVFPFYSSDLTPELIPMSEDGSEVFFETTAALLPQVVTEGVMNVYGWEADGAGACTQSLGCTYLISQGNSQSDSALIGASRDGSNVFFMTRAQLVAQDTDISGDIYDARVDGGFPAPAQSAACLGDTCLSVPPALNDPTPASLSFSGPGNPAPVSTTVKPRAKGKLKKCAKGKVRKKGRCVKRKPVKRKAKKTARRAARHNRGGSK
jgi:hypothetical protein